VDFRDIIKNDQIIGQSPMDGYTDEAFRLVQTAIAKPDVIFTEFVSAEGLSRGGVKLYDTLLYSDTEHPIVGQLFGKDPESFYKSAVVLCHLGFDGVDINMGCPAKTVTQHGSGAALIGKPELAVDIIKAVRSGIDDWFTKKVTINDLKLNNKTLEVIKRNTKYSNSPLLVKGGDGGGFRPTISVKTRIGITVSVVDIWIPLLLSQNLDFITLHGRTLKQGYAGSADWGEINKAVNLAKDSKTLIWGNGDIATRQQGIDYCRKYGVRGVLIGRAALGNPWVFVDKDVDFKEKFNTMVMHAHYFEKVFPNRLFDSLRKNFLLYTSGHPRAKQLRSRIVRLNSIGELYALEDEFLSC
jgi:tRNA-dihydrouridine synthase B